MMKKVFYLALTLIGLSAAGANAQVLIGAEDEPHSSAVLELRCSNKGFLLPQVKLDSATDTSLLMTPEAGMLVCNLTGALKRGVYFWDGKNSQWTLYIGF
jgi:hypothetical protein